MAPSRKQNKKGKITGLRTTLKRPIRPIRSCRLEKLTECAINKTKTMEGPPSKKRII